MAKENVKKFFEELSTNKELQEKFIAVQKDCEVEGKSEEEVLEDIVLPMAKEAGYEFTMSEYKNAQRDAMAEKGISEEELENVSGGGFCCIVGFGKHAGLCIAAGLSQNTLEDKPGTLTGGLGVHMCCYFGAGFGGFF